MKIIKIIKWGSLSLSIACFASISLIPSNIQDDIPQDTPQQVEEDVVLIETPEEILPILPTDCKGIINAYENQKDKSAGLTENYYNCIEHNQPNPPSSKEKKSKKE
jgi:hypothetical protein